MAFLDLPLEIRQIIYSYCFSPPYVKDTELNASSAPSSDNVANDFVILCEQSNPTAQKCLHRDAHLSVIRINRQIRYEAYQYFTASHTLNFSEPLDLANEYLFYMPPHGLKHIKSLNMTWKVPKKSVCSASLSERRSGHKPVDVKSDTYKVMQIFETFPELLISIDRLGFTLPMFCACTTGYCRTLQTEIRTDLINSTIMLCEKIIELQQLGHSESREQYFLIEVAWPLDWQITLWRVSKQTYDRVNNQDVIQKGDCAECAAAQGEEYFGYSRHREHDGIFASVDDILQAIESGKRWNPQENHLDDLNPNKNWKVIFHPMGPRRVVNINVRYIETNRKSSSTRSRKRKRSTAITSSTP